MKMRILISVILLTGSVFSSYGQQVDKFSGNLSYGAPLLQVPVKGGPTAGIAVSYSPGIGVNQRSSDVGLGWNLLAGGAIYRGVSGVPDDGILREYDPVSGLWKYRVGCLKTANLCDAGQESDPDTYQTDYKVSPTTSYKWPFEFTAYDSYYVTGPGPTGAMSPHVFDFGNIENQYASVKPQFALVSDFYDTIVSRHYPDHLNSSTPIKFPDDAVSYDGDASSTDPYTGKRNQGYNRATRSLATKNYIEYFTNTEIDNSLPAGLLDYKTDHRRYSTDFVMDGIGAIRITDMNGFVYHYSLPVYVNYTISGTLPLNNSYAPQVYGYDKDYLPNTVKEIYDNSTWNCRDNGSYVVKDPDNNNMVIETRNNAKYAYSWLLTAVTGTDYVDANSNGIADQGDKGYWISYEYGAWSKNFSERTPEYGFSYDYSATSSDFGQNELVDAIDEDNGHSLKLSGKYGTYSLVNKEIYYLNAIKSSTHTAAIIRDLKNDGHSAIEDYDTDFYGHGLVSALGSTSKSLQGTVYDEGGPDLGYSTTQRTSSFTITPKSDYIYLHFDDLDLGSNTTVKIIRGGGAYTTTFSSANNGSGGDSYETFGADVIIQFNVGIGATTGRGFELNWSNDYSTTPKKYIPESKVTRIALFRNSDWADILTTKNPIWTGPVNNSFDFGNFSPEFYPEQWYVNSSNKSYIEERILKSIEFTQDYSLAKKAYSNVYSDIANSGKDTPPSAVASSYSTTDLNNSGKLTLKAIQEYNFKHEKITPSTLFDYGTNNPDFDPKKIDYWGFYKSDVTTNGFSSYRTSQSKDYVDAWSLKSITNPLGNTISIEYESDTYSNVISENGGFRGPQRIYHILSATPSTSSPSLGYKWDITLEDGASLTDYASYVSSSPAGTVKHGQITFKADQLKENYISSGDVTFLSSSQILLSNVQYKPFNRNQYLNVGAGYFNGYNCYFPYLGNGYIHFQLPTSTEVYGGDLRVKAIVSNNGSIDSYREEYTYSGGVTQSEPDRFAGEKSFLDSLGQSYYPKLRGYDYSPHKGSPGVGYSTVTVKNKGQSSNDNGSVVETFATNDQGISNYDSYVRNSLTAMGGPCAAITDKFDTTVVIEVIDKFGAYWGKNLERKILDKNGNTLNIEKNTYDFPLQGAIVENIYIEKVNPVQGQPSGGGGSIPVYSCQYNKKVSILRHYPTVLKKTVSYSLGSSTSAEYLKLDEVTGDAVEVRSTAEDGTISVIRTYPAFRNSNYSSFGPKSVSSSNLNLLNFNAGIKSLVDTVLTGNSNFSSMGTNVYSNVMKVRKFNTTSSAFESASSTIPYYLNKCNYQWVGSLDKYGLFSSTELASNPFSYSTPTSSSSKWRLLNEITLVNEIGDVLETKGVANRYSARKMGQGDLYEIGSANNSNYMSFTFCSFEESKLQGSATYSTGEVKLNGGSKLESTTSIPSHTGRYLVSVPIDASGPEYRVKHLRDGFDQDLGGLQRGHMYRVSVWYLNTAGVGRITATLGGVGVGNSTTVVAGNWTQVNLDFEVPESTTANTELVISLGSDNGSTVYYDDFMFHSYDSPTQGKVYDEVTGRLVAELDNYNFATIYKYDASGRVVLVSKEVESIGVKPIKKVQYNYSRGTN